MLCVFTNISKRSLWRSPLLSAVLAGRTELIKTPNRQTVFHAPGCLITSPPCFSRVSRSPRSFLSPHPMGAFALISEAVSWCAKDTQWPIQSLKVAHSCTGWIIAARIHNCSPSSISGSHWRMWCHNSCFKDDIGIWVEVQVLVQWEVGVKRQGANQTDLIIWLKMCPQNGLFIMTVCFSVLKVSLVNQHSRIWKKRVEVLAQMKVSVCLAWHLTFRL